MLTVFKRRKQLIVFWILGIVHIHSLIPSLLNNSSLIYIFAAGPDMYSVAPACLHKSTSLSVSL